ncbi:MAG: redoxin domain-containing protein [Dehalococcoidia bacterium]|nr:redoxin domain-containing protein [Dehalococcoidia bacterium]
MTAFRTHTDRFVKADAQVLGISVDSFAAAGEFEDKLGLEFPLVSDFPRNETGRAYGVFNEAAGVHNRVTVVIDKDRIIRDVYVEPRDFESHPVHALEALAAL